MREPVAHDAAGVPAPSGAEQADPAARRAARVPHAPAAHDEAAIHLRGEWETRYGPRVLVVDRTYDPDHLHGHVRVGEAAPPADGCWPQLPVLGAAAGLTGRVLFLDLETTGLAGGAGTSAFLVGCGWFEAGRFRTRQLFLPSVASERALLAAVVDLTQAAGTVVTYNGKSFDVPLIETRFLYHRLRTPFDGMAHVDLLHPARRLWRDHEGAAERTHGWDGADEGSGACRLTALERRLCGHVRQGDVPGAEIPERYFRFVREGDARPLEAVLEHNRLDLLSLAMLTARAAHLLDAGAVAASHAREALGLGSLYERAGRLDDAAACYARAVSLALAGARAAGRRAAPAASPVRIEALCASARLARRRRRHAEAAVDWCAVLDAGASGAIAREAREALAIHHEHRLGDPRGARAFAMGSLPLSGSANARGAVEHRLARLDRKLETLERAEPLFEEPLLREGTVRRD